MALALLAIGLGSAAAGFAGSSSSKKQAKKAAKEAERLQQQADNILLERTQNSLELPRIDFSDLQLEPEQLSTLGAVSAARNRSEFNAALNAIGESLFPTALQASAVDQRNASVALPGAAELSRSLDAQNAQLRSDALDVFAPGSSERREATLRGLNSFLNFELPEPLERRLNQRIGETAVRSGQVSGPLANRAAERLTADELRNNFFSAVTAGQNEQALNRSFVADAGVRDSLLPASTIGLELRNSQLRSDALLRNLQTSLSERLTNFQAESDERASNLARNDQLAIQRANLLLGQSNAQTQTANAASQNSASQLNSAFGALGNVIGQEGGLSDLLGGAFGFAAKALVPNAGGLTKSS